MPSPDRPTPRTVARTTTPTPTPTRVRARLGGRLLALTLSAILTGCATPPAADPTSAPVRAVTQVDLQRYAGRWYEIAAYPMFFQRQCIGDTTAEYTLRPDGRIGVLNRCRTANGHAQAEGVAWAVEGSGNARLKVSFFWPFRADYWVIGLSDDYRWAVVGDPQRRYLWILARTPALTPAEFDRARAAARAQGYDLAPLRSTVHGS